MQIKVCTGVMKCELLSTELEGVVFTTPVIDWD
jgi:hypothetical protein